MRVRVRVRAWVRVRVPNLGGYVAHALAAVLARLAHGGEVRGHRRLGRVDEVEALLVRVRVRARARARARAGVRVRFRSTPAPKQSGTLRQASAAAPPTAIPIDQHPTSCM